MVTAGGLDIGRKRPRTHRHPAVFSRFPSQELRNSGSEEAAQSGNRHSRPWPGCALTPRLPTGCAAGLQHLLARQILTERGENEEVNACSATVTFT